MMAVKKKKRTFMLTLIAQIEGQGHCAQINKMKGLTQQRMNTDSYCGKNQRRTQQISTTH